MRHFIFAGLIQCAVLAVTQAGEARKGEDVEGHASGRNTSDATTWRRTLDADPRNASAFWNLLRCLKADDPRDDLAARFAKIDEPAKWFPVFMVECQRTKDVESVLRLAEAMRKLDPADQSVDRYLLRAKLWTGKTEAATAFFRDAFKSLKSPAAKQALREEYLRGMARAGKPVDAYRAFPGGSESFRILAEQLTASGLPAPLRDLIAEHETFFDDDVYLGLYRGQLAFDEKKYAEADAEWTRSFKTIKDELVRHQFESRCILARFGSGKIEECSMTFHWPATSFACWPKFAWRRTIAINCKS
jgi:hypothetical protein